MKYTSRFIFALACAMAPTQAQALSSNDGILVQNSVTPKSGMTGQSVTISGTLKRIDFDNGSVKSLQGNEGRSLEVHTYYPDFTREISSQTTFNSKKDSYQYTTGAFDSGLSYQFITTIGKVDPRCRTLNSLKSKFEQRHLLLNQKISYFRHLGFNDHHLRSYIGLRDLLAILMGRIDSHVSQNFDDLTIAKYTIQLNNDQSASSSVQAISDDFKMKIEADPGNAFQGMSTQITSTITFVGKEWKSHFSSYNYDVEYWWNGSKVGTQDNNKFKNTNQIVFNYTAPKLAQAGTFTIKIYKSWDFFGGHWGYRDLVAFLPYSPNLLQDTVAPAFNLATAKPNSTHRYVQSLSELNLDAQDTFGRNDPATFSAKLTGAQALDLTPQVTKTAIDGGQKYSFTGTFPNLVEGNYQFTANLKDFAGNAAPSYSLPITIDRTAPAITLGLLDNFITNQSQQSLPVAVLDANPITIRVTQNGTQIYQTSDMTFSLPITLAVGLNQIEVSAIDAAGNVASKSLQNLILDQTPPVLDQAIPIAGAQIYTLAFTAGMRSNEPLAHLKINEVAVPLNEARTQGSVQYAVPADGAYDLKWCATDLAGNITHLTVPITVSQKLLRPEMITITMKPEQPTRLMIVGLPGAALAGTRLKVSYGFFQSVEAFASQDGSFQMETAIFSSTMIEAFETNGSRYESYPLTYQLTGTRLSGVVRDNEGRPLPNAKISLSDPNTAAVFTDGSGVFSIANSASGDQTLMIDGSTIQEPCMDCAARKFSTTSIKVTIGLNQANVLQNPIYLNPLYLDGTDITPSQGGAVTSTRAPGVELDIPSSAIAGADDVKISIETISSQFATISPPEFAFPDTIVALEPSGLQFSKPVEVTMPNIDELPIGTNVVIMSFNSRTGTWEPDGVGVVNPDGSSITTKPNQGIRHFSSIYAVPVGMKVTQMGAQDKPGANTFDGAMSTSIQLPSYQSLGTARAPTLYYKSSWAKPNVVVSNVFDVDPQEINQQVDSAEGKVLGYALAEGAVYIEARIAPEFVKAQFSSGALNSDTLTFTGVPNQAAISFGFGLDSFESGVYPYSSHWEIQLKHTILQTVVQRSRKFFLFGPMTEDSRVVYDLSYRRLFPQDFGGSLIVQNKINSPVGSGWMLGGTQKIVNPSSNKILIEEVDGSTSTYDVNNTISTIKALDGSFPMNEGARIQWPYLHVGRISSNNREIHRVDLSNPSAPSQYRGFVPGLSGMFIHNWYHDGEEARHHEHAYTISAQVTDVVETAGTIFALDTRTHALHAGGIGASLGRYLNPALSTPYASFGGSSHPGTWSSQIEAFCISQGFSCPWSRIDFGFVAAWGSYPTAGTGGGTVASSKLNSPRAMAPHPLRRTIAVADTGNHRVIEVNIDTQAVGVIAGNGTLQAKQDNVAATASSLISPTALAYDSTGGLFILTSEGYVRYVDTNGMIRTVGGLPANHPNAILDNRTLSQSVSLSNPQGLALDESRALLYIADTGHHRALSMDVSVGGSYTETIAGTGLPGALGDGGTALSAQLNTPTGLGIDDQGSLLIVDSGNNRIRKVSFDNVGSNAITFKPVNLDNSTLVKNSTGWIRNYRDGSQAFFDVSGREITRQDRLGRQLVSQYNADGNLIEQTDPAGLSTIYQYSGNRLTGIVDPANRATSFHYSGNFLREVVYPDGTSTKYEYADNGLMLREINQAAKATQYVYNSWNRLERVVRPDQTSIAINDSASATMSNNYTGGANGVMKSISDSSFKETVTDANNVSIELKKDESGFISKIKDAQGIVTKIDRNLQGQPLIVYRKFIENNPNLTSDDQYESKVEMTYNGFGDLIRSVDSANGLVQSRTYNLQGDLLSETSPTGVVTTHQLHSTLGVELAISNNILGTLKTTTYGGAYNLRLTEQLPGGGFASYGYDDAGNLITTTQKINASQNAVSTVVRDIAGNVIQSIDPKGQVTRYEHDAWNRLTAVVTPKNERTEYSYTPTGKLVQVKDPEGGLTTYEYNSLDQAIKKTDVLGKIYQYSYDNNNNLTGELDPNGNVKTYTYNSLNQLIKKQLSDNIYTFSYNDEGKLLSAQTKNTFVGVTYKSGGQLPRFVRTYGMSNLAGAPDVTLEQQYDEFERPIKMISPAGETVYGFDVLNRLTSVTHPGNEQAVYSFDSLNRLSQIDRTDGLRSTYAFDLQNGLASIEHRSGGSVLSYFNYARDLNGFTNGVQSTNANRTIAYDPNSQLTSMSSSEIPSESYTYDSLYNRTSDNGGAYTYDNKKQRLTEDYRHFYFYDENGNLISKQEKGMTGNLTQYTYSSENQLTSIKRLEAGNPIPILEAYYEYNGLGHRVSKRVIDRQNSNNSLARYYVYHNEEILLEYNDEQDLLVSYQHAGLGTDDVMSARVSSAGADAAIAPTAGLYRFLKDAQGTITEIVDASNNLIEHTVYSSFGVPVKTLDGNRTPAAASSFKFPFAYTGREMDQESGLYYFRARYYDPMTGRFLQKDPHPGQVDVPATIVNMYSYVANNPYNFMDPSGMSFLGDLLTGIAIGIGSFFTGGLAGALFSSSLLSGIAGSLAGAATGIAIGGISNIIQGNDFFDNVLSNALSGGLFGALGGLAANTNWALGHFDPTNGVKLAQNGSGAYYGGSLTFTVPSKALERLATGALITAASWGLARILPQPYGIIAGIAGSLVGLSVAHSANKYW